MINFVLFYFLSSADRSYGLEYPRRGGEVLCDAMKHHQCNSDSLYMCFYPINRDLLSYAIDIYSIETLRSMQLILLLYMINTIM